MSFLPTDKLPEAGIITDSGNAASYKTGDWRTNVPQFVEENCIHCLFCWIYCPDSAIRLDTQGEKPLMVGFELDHCKGCGICAQHCPPAAKGKTAILMVREEK